MADAMDGDDEVLAPLEPGDLSISEWVRIISRVLKVMAVLVLGGGLASVAYFYEHTSGSAADWVALWTVGGTVIASATLAFFGYSLDLLASIEINGRRRER